MLCLSGSELHSRCVPLILILGVGPEKLPGLSRNVPSHLGHPKGKHPWTKTGIEFLLKFPYLLILLSLIPNIERDVIEAKLSLFRFVILLLPR